MDMKDGFQGHPRYIREVIQGMFWVTLGVIRGTFLGHFGGHPGDVFGSLWVSSGGRFWVTSGVIRGTFGGPKGGVPGVFWGIFGIEKLKN